MNPPSKDPVTVAAYNRQYYEQHKHLKGRSQSAGPSSPAENISEATKAVRERVIRLKGKVKAIEKALSDAEAELSARRQSSRQKTKESSDGKSTSAEKRASKEYRDKHEQKLKTESRKDTKSSSSSGGSSSSSSSTGVADMSERQLVSRVIKIRSLLRDAKRQLSEATQKLGQLAHSDMTSEPGVNEHFARYRSEERIPSK